MTAEIIKNKKNFLLYLLSIALLIVCLSIYYGVYDKLLNGSKEIVTIGVFSDSYWEVQNGYSYRVLNDAIEIFEKQNPGIKVKYESGILKQDYSEWLAGKMLSEDAPDVFYVLPDDFNNFAELGALNDLMPFIKEDKDFDKKAFYSSAYKYGQYNGTQYSMPYECAPKLMFVNKTILDREGIAMPERDWTWNDFYNICKKVTKDTDGNGMTDQFGVVGYTWEEAFSSDGITLFNQWGTQCYMDSHNVEEALSFIEKLNSINGIYNTGSRDFDLGNVVFQPMSFSEYRAYKPYPLSVKKYTSFDWECIPMPAGPSGNNISTLDTLLIAMNKNSNNKRKAWELIKILSYNTQIQSEIFDYSEGVSVLKKVTESDEALQRIMEGNSINQAILSAAVENAVVVPRFRNYDEAMTEVDKAVNAILQGNYNISMGQIIWNRKVNRYLKNNR